MENKYVETRDIKYGCGCVHEIGRLKHGVYWESTGKAVRCNKAH